MLRLRTSAVVKTYAPDPVIAGTEFDYTITMTNNGPSAAQMVTLADIVPAFQQIKDIQITQVNDGNVKPAFSCTPAVDANVDNRLTPSSFTCKSTELPEPETGWNDQSVGFSGLQDPRQTGIALSGQSGTRPSIRTV
ncbi:MAG: DUF11 domain-containing protein [Acidobacteria bacterium]|nr:DUF11 domain-containing protein [Acidobacteriota bacterium]